MSSVIESGPPAADAKNCFSSATITRILASPTAQIRGMAMLLASPVPPQTQICPRLPKMQRQLTVQRRQSPWGQGFCQSAFKDKILGVYWSNYLPNGRSLSKDLVKHSKFGWTTDAPEIYRERSVLQLVVLTSAMGMMAHQTKDQSLRHKAQRMYGTSLVVMAGVMKSPALRTKPSMLVASALLGIFEVSISCPLPMKRMKLIYIPGS